MKKKIVFLWIVALILATTIFAAIGMKKNTDQINKPAAPTTVNVRRTTHPKACEKIFYQALVKLLRFKKSSVLFPAMLYK